MDNDRTRVKCKLLPCVRNTHGICTAEEIEIEGYYDEDKYFTLPACATGEDKGGFKLF